MDDSEVDKLLELLLKYQREYGPDDPELADGTIRLHAVITDLEESKELGGR